MDCLLLLLGVYIKIWRNALGISHLLFADDTLLFFKANRDATYQVKNVLNSYVSHSSTIRPCEVLDPFGKSCLITQQVQVWTKLIADNVNFEEKCLGLPTLDELMTRDKFQNM